jgi:DNA/RNA-binding domain of Phe-tRNA-synthetase-like protein
MIPIESTTRWRQTFPGGCVGVLEISGVDNTPRATALDDLKPALEEQLRRRYQGYSRPDFLALPVLGAYARYYKRFDKTYHVQLQLESAALKGKPLPTLSPLVDANFMAELETLILTAGHDAAKLQGPLVIDVTDGMEPFIPMNGVARTLRPGDMCMADAGGVSCTIIYGQDQRSPITAHTRRALYVSYAPPGVEPGQVQQHLEKVRGYISLFAPQARLEQQQLFIA